MGGAAISFLLQRQSHTQEVTERQVAEMREAALNFLEASHLLYEKIAASAGASGQEPETVAGATRKAQQALEYLRFACSGSAVELAETMWAHLRSHPVAQGRSTPAELPAWKQQYWALRKRTVNQVRMDSGLGKLGENAG